MSLLSANDEFDMLLHHIHGAPPLRRSMAVSQTMCNSVTRHAGAADLDESASTQILKMDEAVHGVRARFLEGSLMLSDDYGDASEDIRLRLAAMRVAWTVDVSTGKLWIAVTARGCASRKMKDISWLLWPADGNGAEVIAKMWMSGAVRNDFSEFFELRDEKIGSGLGVEIRKATRLSDTIFPHVPMESRRDLPTVDQETIAVKVYVAPVSYAQIHREVAMLAVGQGHPNIIKYYGLFLLEGDENGPWGIAQNLCQSDLQAHVAYEPLQDTDALRDISQIAAGLEFIHDKGIVHRDVKAENVLVADGVCYLADFGNASYDSDRLLMSEKRGSIPYAAPELLLSMFDRCSFPLDIFSTGVLLFYLLCAKLPLMKCQHNPEGFDQAMVEELARASRSLRRRRGVRRGLRSSVGSMIKSMCYTKPSDRPLAGQVRALSLALADRSHEPLDGSRFSTGVTEFSSMFTTEDGDESEAGAMTPGKRAVLEDILKSQGLVHSNHSSDQAASSSSTPQRTGLYLDLAAARALRQNPEAEQEEDDPGACSISSSPAATPVRRCRPLSAQRKMIVEAAQAAASQKASSSSGETELPMQRETSICTTAVSPAQSVRLVDLSCAGKDACPAPPESSCAPGSSSSSASPAAPAPVAAKQVAPFAPAQPPAPGTCRPTVYRNRLEQTQASSSSQQQLENEEPSSPLAIAAALAAATGAGMVVERESDDSKAFDPSSFSIGISMNMGALEDAGDEFTMNSQAIFEDERGSRKRYNSTCGTMREYFVPGGIEIARFSSVPPGMREAEWPSLQTETMNSMPKTETMGSLPSISGATSDEAGGRVRRGSGCSADLDAILRRNDVEERRNLRQIGVERFHSVPAGMKEALGAADRSPQLSARRLSDTSVVTISAGGDTSGDDGASSTVPRVRHRLYSLPIDAMLAGGLNVNRFRSEPACVREVGPPARRKERKESLQPPARGQHRTESVPCNATDNLTQKAEESVAMTRKRRFSVMGVSDADSSATGVQGLTLNVAQFRSAPPAAPRDEALDPQRFASEPAVPTRPSSPRVRKQRPSREASKPSHDSRRPSRDTPRTSQDRRDVPNVRLPEPRRLNTVSVLPFELGASEIVGLSEKVFRSEPAPCQKGCLSPSSFGSNPPSMSSRAPADEDPLVDRRRHSLNPLALNGTPAPPPSRRATTTDAPPLHCLGGIGDSNFAAQQAPGRATPQVPAVSRPDGVGRLRLSQQKAQTCAEAVSEADRPTRSPRAPPMAERDRTRAVSADASMVSVMKASLPYSPSNQASFAEGDVGVGADASSSSSHGLPAACQEAPALGAPAEAPCAPAEPCTVLRRPRRCLRAQTISFPPARR
eukprot:TRINITY_DN26840_c0_g1_i1.p1 TRINITY_DN26840_c0_g1~~TRINITY_DN26840_c0_g1_i1.p1  ORF type:complete len:1350 (+),score=202.00 TRINITY_DN26840_c0_g1_i1:46-4095(+)